MSHSQTVHRGRALRRARIILPTAVLVAVALVAGIRSGSNSASAEGTPQYGPYLIHRPANLSRAKPVPLVIVIHGFGATPQSMQSATQMSSVADRYGFVAAYPDISKGTYTDLAAKQGPTAPLLPDMQFLSSLIDKITADENIDRARVFMTGLSAGAGLSYRAACQLAGKVRGVAPVSASDIWPTCRPAQPVAVYAIRGTNDPFSPAAKMQATLEHWQSVDGCGPATTTTRVGSATVQTWSCKAGSAVAGVSIAGGTHTWPGAPGIPASAPDGQFDASTQMWKFFAGLSSAQQRLLAIVPKKGPPSLTPTQVSPGSVSLTVYDRSVKRNFHLVGPGVNRRTTVRFVGTAHWIVTLDSGVYRFGSDASGLKGRLRVQ